MTTTIEAHIADTNNPHQVTKDQIGLGMVRNYPPASENEIKALTRNDRYIRESDAPIVKVAFNDYLYSIGLTDAQGWLKIATIDGVGTAVFIIDPETQAVNIRGSHPTAHSVDVFIHSVDDPYDLIYNQLDIFIQNGLWVANTSGLGLNPYQSYILTVVHRDDEEKFLTKLKVTNQSEYLTRMLIDPRTFIAHLFGYAAGAVYVKIEVFEEGVKVYTKTDIPVDPNTGYFWEHTMENYSIDPTSNYMVRTTLLRADRSEITHFDTVSSNIHIRRVIQFLLDPHENAWLGGYLLGAVRIHAIVTRNGNILYENTDVSVDLQTGVWGADVSSLDLTSTTDTFEAWVRGYDFRGNQIFDDTEPLRRVPWGEWDSQHWRDWLGDGAGGGDNGNGDNGNGDDGNGDHPWDGGDWIDLGEL